MQFVKAGGCITQKQLQEAQKRYVNTPEGVIILLEGEIRNLCREIETLVQESQQISLGNSLSNVAAKYFGLLFTSDLLGYMREVAIADVLFNDGYGPEAGISLGVEEFQTNDCNSLVAVTTTSVTITRETLRIVFPHLKTTNNSESLGNRLINRRLQMRGSTRFEWDNSTRKVTRIISQSDMMTPILGLLGNLEDVSKVFEKALISPKFQWRIKFD
ncbi:hypothetical protein P3T76_015398 [Phytophthora citrophthora]|uniref:Uncharacterized protein n=1 Tax=Phytophthora citrophthora TaxID=4793 RepID=A0AAD9LA85_9STRA|nr:hypothetical protein P3T76_015398 [Phytophthora citrophthora]